MEKEVPIHGSADYLNKSYDVQLAGLLCPCSRCQPQLEKDYIGLEEVFLWEGGGERKKLHLVKWKEVIRPKSEGDLGLGSLE